MGATEKLNKDNRECLTLSYPRSGARDSISSSATARIFAASRPV